MLKLLLNVFLFSLFTISFSSLATVAELHPDFYSASGEDKAQFNKKYQWLYELIMPEEQRRNAPNATKRSFEVHLKDSKKIFPHPDDLVTNKLSSSLPYKATGTITYSGIVNGRYKYDLYFDDDNVMVIEVRVHFKPEEQGLVEIMDLKIQQAEDKWNNTRIHFPISYRFKFSAERNRARSHFSVRLKKGKTRGPYFSNWTTRWSSNTVAHELGHMMGLGDEYRTITGKMDCLKTSIMCSNSRGFITYQHHYHILRRSIQGWVVGMPSESFPGPYRL